jgi:hypothetical protein
MWVVGVSAKRDRRDDAAEVTPISARRLRPVEHPGGDPAPSTVAAAHGGAEVAAEVRRESVAELAAEARWLRDELEETRALLVQAVVRVRDTDDARLELERRAQAAERQATQAETRTRAAIEAATAQATAEVEAARERAKAEAEAARERAKRQLEEYRRRLRRRAEQKLRIAAERLRTQAAERAEHAERRVRAEFKARAEAERALAHTQRRLDALVERLAREAED